VTDSLQAFIDESWNGQFFVLAGFVFTAQAAQAFSLDWGSALQEAPAIKYFKMNEVNGKTKGQFASFSGKERQEKLLSLARVAGRHAGAYFSVSVPVEYFDSILVPALPEEFRFPYLWLFNGLVTAMSSYEFHVGERRLIDFTFDEQRQFLAKAIALYERVKIFPPFKEHDIVVGRIEAAQDQTVLPLQAADMLVGQVRLFLASPKPRVLHPCLAELKTTVPFAYNHVLEAPQLLDMANNIQRWSGQW
jgi:hypothetical protein